MKDYLKFDSRREFRKWLEASHENSPGVWLLFSKTKAIRTVSANDALEEALCFGWIDGLVKKVDEETYTKYFSRRSRKSKWSKKNRALLSKLLKSGRVTESGESAVREAKRVGTWMLPERDPVTDGQIQTLIDHIGNVEPALSNFGDMSPSVRRTYAAFYLSAKQERTRVRRLATIIERLNQNLKPL
jgi:uncharacterized protein YdeI (YjbR/CyaY-like superfamily)